VVKGERGEEEDFRRSRRRRKRRVPVSIATQYDSSRFIDMF
jgi:hypothetical protein